MTRGYVFRWDASPVSVALHLDTCLSVGITWKYKGPGHWGFGFVVLCFVLSFTYNRESHSKAPYSAVPLSGLGVVVSHARDALTEEERNLQNAHCKADSMYCANGDNDGGWMCTLAEGHSGVHAAHVGDDLRAVWLPREDALLRPAVNRQQPCEALHHETGLRCLRVAGHGGKHAAFAGAPPEPRFVWPTVGGGDDGKA